MVQTLAHDLSRGCAGSIARHASSTIAAASSEPPPLMSQTGAAAASAVAVDGAAAPLLTSPLPLSPPLLWNPMSYSATAHRGPTQRPALATELIHPSQTPLLGLEE